MTTDTAPMLATAEPLTEAEAEAAAASVQRLAAALNTVLLGRSS